VSKKKKNMHWKLQKLLGADEYADCILNWKLQKLLGADEYADCILNVLIIFV